MARFFRVSLFVISLSCMFFSITLSLPLARRSFSTDLSCCADLKEKILDYGGSIASNLVARDVSFSMIATVNMFRRTFGRKPFNVNRKLIVACKAHVTDMASRNFMSHVGSDGSTPAIRAMRAGYNWRAIAENVAAGQTTVQSVLYAWIHSPGHRANLLSTSTTEFAAAQCENTNGDILHMTPMGLGVSTFILTLQFAFKALVATFYSSFSFIHSILSVSFATYAIIL